MLSVQKLYKKCPSCGEKALRAYTVRSGNVKVYCSCCEKEFKLNYILNHKKKGSVKND